MIKQKTFLQALSTIMIDIKKVDGFLTDKRLTHIEKNILQMWKMIRNNKCQDVLDQVASLKSNEAIIQAQLYLLQGVAYNNKCESYNSIKYLELSLKIMQELNLDSFQFVVYSNLFTANLNLKNLKGMSTALEGMNSYVPHNQFQQIYLELTQFKYFSYIGQYDQAESIQNDLQKKFVKMNEHQKLSFLIAKFVFFIKVDKPLLSRKVLSEIKQHRKYQLSANFKYMKLLIDHLIDDKTLYIRDVDFIDYPTLYNMIKVIEALACRNMSVASAFWSKLMQIESDTYLSDFTYNGDKCLFSVCLDKHLKHKPLICESNKQHQFENKEDAVLHILESLDAPIRKEEIYQKIWGAHPVDKTDLQKLEKIISRLRKKYTLTIKSSKGCYHLMPKRSLKSVI